MPSDRRQCPARGGRTSVEWRRHHRTTPGPQRIQAARELEWRALTEIALEALAVVSDLLDDIEGPRLVEAERLSVVVQRSEEHTSELQSH